MQCRIIKREQWYIPEGTALVLLGLQLALLGLVGQLLDNLGDRLDATGIGTLDNGGDQSSGCGDRDRDVNVLELLGVVARAELDIGLGNVAQGQGSSLDQKVVHRDLDFELV